MCPGVGRSQMDKEEQNDILAVYRLALMSFFLLSMQFPHQNFARTIHSHMLITKCKSQDLHIMQGHAQCLRCITAYQLTFLCMDQDSLPNK